MTGRSIALDPAAGAASADAVPRLDLFMLPGGVPFELHVFPHGPHGLGLGEPGSAVAAWTGLCARWLRGRGLGE